VAIDTVSVHHAEHPNIFHARKVFLNQVRVLVCFPHLRDKSSACLISNFFNKIVLIGTWVCSQVLKENLLLRLVPLLTFLSRLRDYILASHVLESLKIG